MDRPRSPAESAVPSSSSTDSRSGEIRPSSVRASVVLPLPDSPTSPSVSPRMIVRFTPVSARTAFSPIPNVLVSDLIVTIGVEDCSLLPSESPSDAVVRGSSATSACR